MANNPYVNKVQFGDETLIDISGDTITANKMLSGTTAHDKSGASITGNIPIRSSSDLQTSNDSYNGNQLVGITGSAGYYSSNFGAWISEVYMDIPDTSSHKFTIYIPNGSANDFIPLEIEVDQNGNSTVTA